MNLPFKLLSVFVPAARREPHLRIVLLAAILSLSVTGCGGGSGPEAGVTPAGSISPSPVATSVKNSDGAAAEAVPIVKMPATGDCGPTGAAAPSPTLNSRLDCAP